MNEEFTKSHTNICKGIAICLMIIHHLFWNVPNIGYQMGGIALSQRIGIIGKVCVSIFLILSGVGTFRSTKQDINIKKFYKNKILRLYINYLFIVFTSIIIGIVLFNKEVVLMLGVGIKGVIKFILTCTGIQYIIGYQGFNASWWFMSVIILCYLIYPKIVRLLDIYKSKMLLICFLISFIDVIDIGRFKIFSILSWTFPFILGVYIAQENILIKIKEHIRNNEKNSIGISEILIVLILVGLLYARQAVDPQGSLSYKLDYILALVIIINVYLFLNIHNRVNKAIMHLGENSMNIYFIHMFVTTYYLNNITYSLKNPIVMFLFTLLISLIWSIFINKLKEFTKFECYTNKLLNNIR